MNPRRRRHNRIARQLLRSPGFAVWLWADQTILYLTEGSVETVKPTQAKLWLSEAEATAALVQYVKSWHAGPPEEVGGVEHVRNRKAFRAEPDTW